MYSQRQRQSGVVMLPHTRMTVNNQELNDLQRRMLANYYQKQIRQKTKDSLLTPQLHPLHNPHSPQNPEQPHHNPQQSITHFQINQQQLDRQRIMRMKLAQEYEQQITRKEQKKKKQLEQKKKQQEAFAYQFQILSDLENEKIRRSYEMRKERMREEMEMVERRKEEKMDMKRREQQMFNQRYGRMPRSTSLGNVQASPKIAQFKKHYENISTIQKQIENNYLSKWSPIIKQKQYQKDKLVHAGIMRNMREASIKTIQNSEEQQRLQSDLKTSLIQQIVERERQKQQEQRHHKNEQYTTRNYDKIYHPICNPVDFRVNHDNKYILRELKEEKEQKDRSTQSTSSQTMSGLARNGSLSLLAK